MTKVESCITDEQLKETREMIVQFLKSGTMVSTGRIIDLLDDALKIETSEVEKKSIQGIYHQIEEFFGIDPAKAALYFNVYVEKYRPNIPKIEEQV